ncbi:hypothetical protein BwSF12_55150 [Bradyrhizobium ottawaense]|uniref:hypothetical protein n=1 Tax=Bradyrhizobium ottawaense TaxID=931866 RepID=UPI0027D68D7C|nr:hypothetical protein BwSF12_55150 [Bradyrhizobium ottawaense]GMO95768.1 hypothetical protein BwSF19_76220 [Bradyrhizobium ottawaense]
MKARSAQIAAACQCIDHCFGFAIWCEDFARHVDPEDMVMGLDRGFDLISDATRLHSFLAVRKMDEFFRGAKRDKDDVIATDLGIDPQSVLGNVGSNFLTTAERTSINKGAAHLTDQLFLEPESELELDEILKRSMPVFARLTTELRKADTAKEATHWLDKTDALLKRVEENAKRKQDEAATSPKEAASSGKASS